jgi:hypothetical protein
VRSRHVDWLVLVLVLVLVEGDGGNVLRLVTSWFLLIVDDDFHM